MKAFLIGIALVASVALSSCVALPPPPGGGGRPAARAAVYRPAPPKPKKQVRLSPQRMAYGNMSQGRADVGRPGPRR